jgi:hypothetical protein
MRKGQKEMVNTEDKVIRANDYAFATSDLTNVAKKIDVPVEKCGAIIDSGTTSHFCPDHSKFVTFTSIKAQDVHTADGSTISAVGKGDIKIDLPLGTKKTTVTLKDTLYTLKMAFTLISANRITTAGFAVHLEDRMCRILTPALEQRPIAKIPQIDGLCRIALSVTHSANSAITKCTIDELHQVLGHVSHEVITNAIKKGMISGITLDENSKPTFCKTCTKAKATRQLFPNELKTKSSAYGDLVHTDLWGPAQTATINGCLYYISFTDDYSQETRTIFLKKKSKALATFKQYEAYVSHQYGA